MRIPLKVASGEWNRDWRVASLIAGHGLGAIVHPLLDAPHKTLPLRLRSPPPLDHYSPLATGHYSEPLAPHHPISTSAGERTEESSRVAGRTGRWTDRTRQPWCLSTPWNGGLASTLPSSRIAAGSKSVGTWTSASSAALMIGSMLR